MTGNETTDSGLTPDQEIELTALLRRAADALDVQTPVGTRVVGGGAAATTTQSTRRSTRTRWTIGAVAAVGLLIAGGTWFVTGAEDSQQVASGGPDASGEEASRSIWQWPGTIPEGLEVTRAATSTSRFGFQLAVDDPAAPTRWLGITPTWFGFSTGATDAPIASGTLEGGATYALYAPRADSTTGATWAELIGPGQTGYLTIAALGVEPQAIINVLAEVDSGAGNLTDVEAMDAALRTITLPEGLEPAWNPEDVGFQDFSSEWSDPSGLALVLGSPGDGDRIGVSIDEVGMAPAVASLDLQLRLDANNAGHGAPGQTVTRRDDLGKGALVVEDEGDRTSVYMFSEGGVRRTASDVMNGRAGQTTLPVGLTTLVDVLRGLRVVSESELRDRLTAAGLDPLTPGEPGDRGAPSTTQAPITTLPTTTAVAGG